MSTVLITGTSRGIGLELVRQLLAQSESTVKRVLAVTRDSKSTALAEVVEKSHGRVVNIVIPNIIDESVIQSAIPSIQEALAGDPLDILINNAGAMDYQPDGIASVSAAQLNEVFSTNVGSIQAMTSTLLPLFRGSSRKEIVNIGTSLGSLSLVDGYASSPVVGYKTSKAAVNMLTRLWAHEYSKEGFYFFVLSPGWLKTDMGTDNADLPVEVGVEAVVEVILSADKTSNDRFRNIQVPGYEKMNGPHQYDGKDFQW